MKIYNETKTQIIENPDLKLGRLKDDRIVINVIPAQEEVKEVYHYEYVEYENGGRDRIKIIDTPYSPKKPQEEVYEEIQVYVPYTQEELILKQEDEIVKLIRQKYNINQELAILRQREVKPEEFADYNEYVEQCKKQVKNVHNYEEVLANVVNQESEQEGTQEEY